MLPDEQEIEKVGYSFKSQCTCRCVVLPDLMAGRAEKNRLVSMHLQVRGAP